MAMTPEKIARLLSPESRSLFDTVVMSTVTKNEHMNANPGKISIRIILLQRQHWLALNRHLKLLMELEDMQATQSLNTISCSSNMNHSSTPEDEFELSNFDPDCKEIL